MGSCVRVLSCLSQPAPLSLSYRVSHSLHHCPCLTLSLTACTTVPVLPCLSQPAPLSVSYRVSHSLPHCPCLTVSLTACTTVRVLPCLSQPAPLSESYLVFKSLHHFSDSLVHGRHHATEGFAFFVSHVGAVVIFIMLGYFNRAVWSAVRQVHEERLARIGLVDDLD